MKRKVVALGITGAAAVVVICVGASADDQQLQAALEKARQASLNQARLLSWNSGHARRRLPAGRPSSGFGKI